MNQETFTYIHLISQGTFGAYKKYQGAFFTKGGRTLFLLLIVLYTFFFYKKIIILPEPQFS